jgi:nucleolar complex protein 2
MPAAHVLDSILELSLEKVPMVLDYHLKTPEKKLPSTCPKWKKCSPLVKSFLSSILLLLKQLTDSSLLSRIIQHSQAFVSYYACFPKLSKEWIRQLVRFWSDSEEQVRVVAFLCLRQLILHVPSLIDSCFKQAYRAFTLSSKNTSTFTWPAIHFMMQCLVEMAGLDLLTAYQMGFTSIRELALELRTALQSHTQENMKKVLSWPFVHRLVVWSKILSSFYDSPSSQLSHLIYPLVQVSLGLLRLKSSSNYFPLRFLVIKMLVNLGSKTHQFIPLASYVLEIFGSSEITGKAKPSTLKPLEFQKILKAPKGYLQTRVYQDGLIEEAIHLLFDIYSSQVLSISFPELIIPGVIQLKRLSKSSKNLKLNKLIHVLLEKVRKKEILIFRWK